jgi:hypothetical protein
MERDRGLHLALNLVTRAACRDAAGQVGSVRREAVATAFDHDQISPSDFSDRPSPTLPAHTRRPARHVSAPDERESRVLSVPATRLERWLSNPAVERRLARLVGQGAPIKEPSGAMGVPSHSIRLRKGQLPAAISEVLANAGELPLSEIHASVESLLGRVVSYSAMKQSLARHSTGSDATVQRVRHGRYRLA